MGEFSQKYSLIKYSRGVFRRFLSEYFVCGSQSNSGAVNGNANPADEKVGIAELFVRRLGVRIWRFDRLGDLGFRLLVVKTVASTSLATKLVLWGLALSDTATHERAWEGFSLDSNEMSDFQLRRRALPRL